MATIEQEQEEYKKLRAALDQLQAIEPESLARSDVLGKELNFEAGIPVFRRTLGLFRSLADCNLENFPHETLSQLLGQANDVLSLFQQIKSFSIQQHSQNPTGVRDSLIQQMRDRWHQYYQHVAPHIAYAVRRGTDFAALEREARGTLALQQKVAGEFQAEKDKVLKDMNDALSKVRQAAAEVGVAQHAVHFNTEAEFHRTQSRIWLGATLGFGLATIFYALYSLGPELNDLTSTTIPRAIQLVVPRLVVIFVLTFGLIWAARNFAASRHNFVVNRHRQNALSSFETFVKGASDDPTKNAVLLQATQSIFTPQDSGFVKAEGTPQPGSQIVEVIRGISSGKS